MGVGFALHNHRLRPCAGRQEENRRFQGLVKNPPPHVIRCRHLTFYISILLIVIKKTQSPPTIYPSILYTISIHVCCVRTRACVKANVDKMKDIINPREFWGHCPDLFPCGFCRRFSILFWPLKKKTLVCQEGIPVMNKSLSLNRT